MNPFRFLPGACLLLVLLTGCGGGASGDAEAPAAAGKVAVTTAQPVRQTFHAMVKAWGSAVGDPHRMRTLSLAHGGQIIAVHVVAGQIVKRGQSLLTMTPDPATRSVYQQAESALVLSRGELGRIQELARQRLATQSQLAAARKALADAQVALDAQRSLGGGAAQEIVTAPADGVVTTLSAGLGDRMAANAPLLGFTPAQALVAQLGLQPESAAKLRPGMPVQLTNVYDSTMSFAATLSMVGQTLNPQTRLLDVQVELPAEASAKLVAGTALEATIRLDDFVAWAVPRTAVLHDDDGDYLFQVEREHAKRINVKLRSPEGDIVGVQGALSAQAQVIVLGAYELGDGDPVIEKTARKSSAANASSVATPGLAQ